MKISKRTKQFLKDLPQLIDDIKNMPVSHNRKKYGRRKTDK